MEDLNELAAEAKREYQRNWRANNKDKVKAMNQRYWLRKAILKKNELEVRGVSTNAENEVNREV